MMENMFTGMTQICHQEKVIGYARIRVVEISTLLDEVTVTTATSTAMSLATVLTGVTLTLLHECLQGRLVHQVTVSHQEKWPGTDHHPVIGVWVILEVIQLDHLQIVQDGLQIRCRGKEWASVVTVS